MKRYLLVGLLIFIAAFLLPFIHSCTGYPGGCGDVPKNFDINGLQTIAYDNNLVQEVTENDTVDIYDYRIKGVFDATYYSNAKKKPRFMPFINACYALSCLDPGYNGSTEGLQGIWLVTQQDWNTSFAQGDTINSIVEANSESSFSMKPIPTFIIENSAVIHRQYIYFKLLQEPDNKNIPHSFTLVIKLKNGETYSQQTDAVYFR